MGSVRVGVVVAVALVAGGCRCVGAERGERYRTHRFDPGLSDAEREEIAQLEALGYAAGTRPGSGQRSVVRHDPERAWPGFNLSTSGHAPIAILTDMEGREIHRWEQDFWSAFPGYPVERDHDGVHCFRRAWLLDGGDLLAIYEGLGAVRLDARSRLRWSNPGRMHHDADLTPEGAVLVLTREVKKARHLRRGMIVEDFVSTLDAGTGRELGRLSLLAALEASPFAGMLADRLDKPDFLHTNTLTRLDGRGSDRDPAFAAGNLLVSMRNLDLVAVVDPRREVVVWAHRGDFALQHDPSVTADGDLLLFDNAGPLVGSRVLRLRLPALETVWSWSGPEGARLDSDNLGAAQELPNGNILVTDSVEGRALEVVPATGEVVWEFHNPARLGDDEALVAALMEVTRLPATTDLTWADRPPPGDQPPGPGPGSIR